MASTCDWLMSIPPSPPSTLRHEDIARRIPHQGSMCLLDRVTAWDHDRISCQASSHQASDNPLRANGQLGAACGIEYAAQAMAVHGALIAEALASGDGDGHGPGPKIGYLASVRGVTLHVARLDHLSDVLSIFAERVSGDASTILYSFAVHAGSAELLSGRAVVVLQAQGQALQAGTGMPSILPAAATTPRPS